MNAWMLFVINIAFRWCEFTERHQVLVGDAIATRIRQRWGL